MPLQYCLDRRTMEMDADAAAITAAFDDVLGLYDGQQYKEMKISYQCKEDMFRIWGFYLPNRERFIMVMNAAKETAKLYIRHNMSTSLGTNIGVIWNAIIQGVEECELFFKTVYNCKYEWSKYIISPDYSYICYSDEVLENWDNSLRERLEPYSRAPLYDKDSMDEIMWTQTFRFYMATLIVTVLPYTDICNEYFSSMFSRYVFHVAGMIMAVIFLYITWCYGIRLRASSDAYNAVLDSLPFAGLKRNSLKDSMTTVEKRLLGRMVGGRLSMSIPIVLFLSLIILNLVVLIMETVQ